MKSVKKIFFKLIVAVFFINVTVALTVNTSNGILSGTFFSTSEGRVVHAFLGVPYAKPPVGEYRFKEPRAPDGWDGVRPAHNFSSQCIQYIYYIHSADPVLGDEDCLYLNIFTPTVSSNAKLNVIVYIHGGGFMFGTGNMFTADYILNHHDIVFITINYRVGPFGFLTTEDGVIPGNNGLKDQVMAFRWIQNNIKMFGGDEQKVTLVGLSAGGASVQLHYMSKMSKHLFAKGISIRGTAFCPWVLAENSYAKAITLAKSVGCFSKESNEMLRCFQSKNAKSILLNLEQLFMPWNYNPFSPFGPVVEKYGNNLFLDENPHKKLISGEIKNAPWLVSMTTEEALFPAAQFIRNDTLLRELDEEWNKNGPHLLDYFNTVPQHLLQNVSEAIRLFYFGKKKISRENWKELIKMMGDRLFYLGIERAARVQASGTNSPVYLYNFAYRGKHSLSNHLCKCDENLGTSHGDDVVYVLKTLGRFSPLETKGDVRMMKTLIKIWLSFVQDSEPSVGGEIIWSPVPQNITKEGNIPYMKIFSSKNIKLLSSTDLSNAMFWDSLPFDVLDAYSTTKKMFFDEL